MTACCIEEIPQGIGRPNRRFCRHCDHREGGGKQSRIHDVSWIASLRSQ